jgi:hypothetical protein
MVQEAPSTQNSINVERLLARCPVEPIGSGSWRGSLLVSALLPIPEQAGCLRSLWIVGSALRAQKRARQRAVAQLEAELVARSSAVPGRRALPPPSDALNGEVLPPAKHDPIVNGLHRAPETAEEREARAAALARANAPVDDQDMRPQGDGDRWAREHPPW